ncbi:hypothetical protein BESB_025530 [Besnoitia besnoiti]|uniref:Uncharacterized protein n=1 Tax=Besnoitia besnoiti TaxID=94643 RepID=A0A2A9M0U3_BESBE|nr:uncharacterized protein BESB_025530 [Besnoitia besnoiti]PFH31579.1 hypothetical protein BESB_025530 [Besnoitia besnoiti]
MAESGRCRGGAPEAVDGTICPTGVSCDCLPSSDTLATPSCVAGLAGAAAQGSVHLSSWPGGCFDERQQSGSADRSPAVSTADSASFGGAESGSSCGKGWRRQSVSTASSSILITRSRSVCSLSPTLSPHTSPAVDPQISPAHAQVLSVEDMCGATRVHSRVFAPLPAAVGYPVPCSMSSTSSSSCGSATTQEGMFRESRMWKKGADGLTTCSQGGHCACGATNEEDTRLSSFGSLASACPALTGGDPVSSPSVPPEPLHMWRATLWGSVHFEALTPRSSGASVQWSGGRGGSRESWEFRQREARFHTGCKSPLTDGDDGCGDSQRLRTVSGLFFIDHEEDQVKRSHAWSEGCHRRIAVNLKGNRASSPLREENLWEGLFGGKSSDALICLLKQLLRLERTEQLKTESIQSCSHCGLQSLNPLGPEADPRVFSSFPLWKSIAPPQRRAPDKGDSLLSPVLCPLFIVNFGTFASLLVLPLLAAWESKDLFRAFMSSPRPFKAATCSSVAVTADKTHTTGGAGGEGRQGRQRLCLECSAYPSFARRSARAVPWSPVQESLRCISHALHAKSEYLSLWYRAYIVRFQKMSERHQRKSTNRVEGLHICRDALRRCLILHSTAVAVAWGRHIQFDWPAACPARASRQEPLYRLAALCQALCFQQSERRNHRGQPLSFKLRREHEGVTRSLLLGILSAAAEREDSGAADTDDVFPFSPFSWALNDGQSSSDGECGEGNDAEAKAKRTEARRIRRALRFTAAHLFMCDSQVYLHLPADDPVPQASGVFFAPCETTWEDQDPSPDGGQARAETFPRVVCNAPHRPGTDTTEFLQRRDFQANSRIDRCHRGVDGGLATRFLDVPAAGMPGSPQHPPAHPLSPATVPRPHPLSLAYHIDEEKHQAAPVFSPPSPSWTLDAGYQRGALARAIRVAVLLPHTTFRDFFYTRSELPRDDNAPDLVTQMRESRSLHRGDHRRTDGRSKGRGRRGDANRGYAFVCSFLDDGQVMLNASHEPPQPYVEQPHIVDVLVFSWFGTGEPSPASPTGRSAASSRPLSRSPSPAPTPSSCSMSPFLTAPQQRFTLLFLAADGRLYASGDVPPILVRDSPLSATVKPSRLGSFFCAHPVEATCSKTGQSLLFSAFLAANVEGTALTSGLILPRYRYLHNPLSGRMLVSYLPTSQASCPCSRLSSSSPTLSASVLSVPLPCVGAVSQSHRGSARMANDGSELPSSKSDVDHPEGRQSREELSHAAWGGNATTQGAIQSEHEERDGAGVCRTNPCCCSARAASDAPSSDFFFARDREATSPRVKHPTPRCALAVLQTHTGDPVLLQMTFERPAISGVHATRPESAGPALIEGIGGSREACPVAFEFVVLQVGWCRGADKQKLPAGVRWAYEQSSCATGEVEEATKSRKTQRRCRVDPLRSDLCGGSEGATPNHRLCDDLPSCSYLPNFLQSGRWAACCLYRDVVLVRTGGDASEASVLVSTLEKTQHDWLASFLLSHPAVRVSIRSLRLGFERLTHLQKELYSLPAKRKAGAHLRQPKGSDPVSGAFTTPSPRSKGENALWKAGASSNGIQQEVRKADGTTISVGRKANVAPPQEPGLGSETEPPNGHGRSKDLHYEATQPESKNELVGLLEWEEDDGQLRLFFRLVDGAFLALNLHQKQVELVWNVEGRNLPAQTATSEGRLR